MWQRQAAAYEICSVKREQAIKGRFLIFISTRSFKLFLRNETLAKAAERNTHTHSNRCRRQNRQGNRAFNFQTITVRPKKKLRGETLLSLDWRGVDRNANATPKWVWTRDEFRVHTICMHETNELTKRRLSQCVWHNEHNEIPEFNSQVRWLLPRESGKICERCLNECPNHYFNCSDQESPQSNRTRSQTRIHYYELKIGCLAYWPSPAHHSALIIIHVWCEVVYRRISLRCFNLFATEKEIVCFCLAWNSINRSTWAARPMHSSSSHTRQQTRIQGAW